jgi:anti-anti-sigma factor
VDSSGIGELVRGHMAMSKQGGRLKLTNLTKVVSDLLQATALTKVFDIHPDEASAVQSCKAIGRGAASN